ncbi:hypothetical protein U9M48_004639 [Paspalum notatum var. saurae]|uniref:Uncharacterized protein n=1 Tax=Paspalum notatum var. saurae TaxID=547442 RepID=A0AAQ3PV55_PASNO
MAEAVVGVLIGKLGSALANQAAAYGASLICKEASALKGLFGEIRKAEEELKSMKAYLRDLEKFKDADETTGIFIDKIRELSFRIEDIVDEFMYKLEDDKNGRFAAKMMKRIKHVKVWHRLALRLRDVNTELEDAAKRKVRYAGSSGHHAIHTNPTVCPAREEDLVGIEDNAAMIKQWLLGDLEEMNNKVITVWGMGGVGKTTLVDHVYKAVKVDFDASAWITVSKSYQAEDLLKKIAREFSISIDSSDMDMRRLTQDIRKHLEGKRYILILDDVWEQDVWINYIMPVFPTNCTSRFILTSRLYEIASLATSNCAVKLEPLQKYQANVLFCRLAFWNSNEKRCPAELCDLAENFLQKCEGLPIAIACISRLLSCKPAVYAEWRNIYDKLELQSTKSMIPGVDKILKVSFEVLPYELKNCFLHCALFPEDYKMKRRRLIRHWITSGFIKQKENKTLEQVAEGYLIDLVNRSLLDVVQKNKFGRMKCFRMHDVIRHLAIDKAMKECFGKVYEGHGTFSVHGTRRLSIQGTDILPLNQSDATHLRAIYVFSSSIDIDLLIPILASSVLLSTLDLQGTQIKVLPNEVFSLFNLRFLGLRYTGIVVIPEAIGRLQNLEVLDAFRTGIVSLPKDIAKLKKLRYLYASSVSARINGQPWYSGGVNVTKGIKQLTGLYALQTIIASLETLSEVAAMTELRTFSVTKVTSEHSLNLCNAIMNMSHLAHLSVDASNDNEVLPLEELRLPETLNKLELNGQIEKARVPQIFSSWSHLNNLTMLNLIFSKLNEDSFPSLKALRELCCLQLCYAYDGKIICFPAQSFPRLKTLYIVGASQLNQIEMEEGALESLDDLLLADCPELKHVPRGIESITSLEELNFRNTSEELIEMLRQGRESSECNEELMKIRHIRKAKDRRQKALGCAGERSCESMRRGAGDVFLELAESTSVPYK